jgi:hypothetical protein
MCLTVLINDTDEDKYPLVDKDGEKKHAFSLARSLSAARRSKIFDDHTFYITANVQPTFDALKQIAEAGGAKVSAPSEFCNGLNSDATPGAGHQAPAYCQAGYR